MGKDGSEWKIGDCKNEKFVRFMRIIAFGD